jgi:hypothetical protein
MSERPTPGLDSVRDALREHDENAEDAAGEREPEERPAPETSQDDDEE